MYVFWLTNSKRKQLVQLTWVLVHSLSNCKEDLFLHRLIDRIGCRFACSLQCIGECKVNWSHYYVPRYSRKQNEKVQSEWGKHLRKTAIFGWNWTTSKPVFLEDKVGRCLLEVPISLQPHWTSLEFGLKKRSAFCSFLQDWWRRSLHLLGHFFENLLFTLCCLVLSFLKSMAGWLPIDKVLQPKKETSRVWRGSSLLNSKNPQKKKRVNVLVLVVTQRHEMGWQYYLTSTEIV